MPLVPRSSALCHEQSLRSFHPNKRSLILKGLSAVPPVKLSSLSPNHPNQASTDPSGFICEIKVPSWEGLSQTKFHWKKQEFRVVRGSHWLSCRGGQLLEEMSAHLALLGPLTIPSSWGFFWWESVTDSSCDYDGAAWLPLLASQLCFRGLPCINFHRRCPAEQTRFGVLG